MNELAKALVKAQAAMNHAAKDSKNPHFKSAYSSLASVIDAVRPALSGNGLAFVQMLHTSETHPSFENGVAVETVLIHESGERLSCGTLFIPASKQDAQGFGSALSYAKRYSLQSALGIASADDDGEAAVKTPPKPPIAVTIDMDYAVDEMTAQSDLSALKTCFAKWYKSAPDTQKEVLKAMYDGIKSQLLLKQPIVGEQ
jgi:hypothetical protein